VDAEEIRQRMLKWVNIKPESARSSEYGSALDALSSAAVQYVQANNAAPSQSDFITEIEAGFNVVTGLRSRMQYCLPEEKRKELKLWSHRDPLYDAKTGNVFDNSYDLDGERAVKEYLDLPYRAPEIDRLFADMLIGTEIYRYAKQMIYPDSVTRCIPGWRSFSPLWQPHPLSVYLNTMFNRLVLVCALGGALFYLQYYHQVNKTVTETFIDYAPLVILFLISWAQKTAALVSRWGAYKRSTEYIRSIVREMIACYIELDSTGPVSARHLRGRLMAAEEKGVVWPAPLHALLDDVTARTGRL
jgi:hypothetical protein